MSPWIPTVALLLAAFAVRIISKSWLAPSAFSLGIWAVYVIAPLLVATEYKVSAASIWWIMALLMSLAAGALLGEGEFPYKRVMSSPIVPTQRIFRVCLFSTALGLIGATYFAVQQLRYYGLDLSGAGLLLVGHMVAGDRYGLGHEPTLLVRLLISWIYPATLLGGMSYALAITRRRKLICLLTIIPTLLYSMLNAAKANTLMALVLGVAGYLSMKITVTGRRSRLLSRKAIITIASCVAIGTSFFFIVDTLRTRSEDDLQLKTDFARFRSASFGYLAVFSKWIDTSDNPGFERMDLWDYTFAGIVDMVGLHSRDDRSVVYESIALEDDGSSNINTAFRGIIEDFSLPGALAFLLLLGFCFGYAYRKCLRGFYGWIPLLAACYAFLIWMPLSSIFFYNGSTIALAICTGTLKLKPRLPLSVRMPFFVSEAKAISQMVAIFLAAELFIIGVGYLVYSLFGSLKSY